MFLALILSPLCAYNTLPQVQLIAARQQAADAQEAAAKRAVDLAAREAEVTGLLEELQRYRELVDSAAGGGRRIGSLDGSSGMGAGGQERGGADGGRGAAESQYMRMLQRRLHAADQQQADYEQQLQQLAVQVGVARYKWVLAVQVGVCAAARVSL